MFFFRGGGGGEVLPFMGDIGMCGLKEYDFSADLVIFSHSGPKLRVWFSFFSFELGMCHFFIIIDKTKNKSPS